MSFLAPRRLTVTTAALAGLMSVAQLPSASPAAAADAAYCHAQYRACQARFNTRTCDRRYETCMAYSSAPSPVVIGGFPRLRRHKHHGEPKAPTPKTGGGEPKSPSAGGSYTSGGWVVKGGGSYTSSGWVTSGSGGGKSGSGGANAGGGGKPQQQQQQLRSGGGRTTFVRSGGGGHSGGGRSGGRR
jgi:hypothetical protein